MDYNFVAVQVMVELLLWSAAPVAVVGFLLFHNQLLRQLKLVPPIPIRCCHGRVSSDQRARSDWSVAASTTAMSS